MSFDALEKSGFAAQPYELFLFQATGIFFALTSADQAITYLGQPYTPSTITRSEMEMSGEVVSGQLKIYIPATHPLALLMLPYLPNFPVAVTIFGSHYGDAETVVLFVGVIGSARFTDQCELTCNSAQYFLQRKIPQQLYQAPCSHVFGDPGCGADLSLHTYNGTVTAIDSTGTILTIPAMASIADPLAGGYMKFGNEYRMIVAQTGATVTLISAIPDMTVGAAVACVAGCGLDFGSCSHYGRTTSFLGFDLIPTVNPFDGSASIG